MMERQQLEQRSRTQVLWEVVPPVSLLDRTGLGKSATSWSISELICKVGEVCPSSGAIESIGQDSVMEQDRNTLQTVSPRQTKVNITITGAFAI